MLASAMASLLRLRLLLALVPSVFALTFKSESIEANFDDRRSTPAAFQFNTVGTYARLHWSGFQIDEPHQSSNKDDFIGVEVKTAPNYAGGQVDDFGGWPSITTEYPGSKVAFFDFQNFWWGCSTIEESTYQQLPGWCTLEVYGFSHGVKEPVAKAVSFFFPKDDVKSMKMVEAHMPSTFNAVSRVEFHILAQRPILYLDSVKYKIYNVTSIGRGLREVINSGSTSQSELKIQVNGG